MCRQFSLLALVLVLVGCNQVKAPIPGRADPYKPMQINYAQQDLADRTAVGEPIVSRDAAGILRVSLPIRAATDLQLYIDWRVRFFDQQGQQLYATNWQTKTLAPNVHDQIQANSLDARAASFQFDLRYARQN